MHITTLFVSILRFENYLIIIRKEYGNKKRQQLGHIPNCYYSHH